MQPVERHQHTPDVSFDGGNMDCGNGLLLLIRRHMDPLDRGGLLEIRSTEISVEEDLPAWCRLTGNELLSWTRQGRQRSYLVAKGKAAERRATDHAEIGDKNRAADHADNADESRAADHADIAGENRAADHADNADESRAADHADIAGENRAADHADNTAADHADIAGENRAADHADNTAADHADSADENRAADHADNTAADHADNAGENRAADHADSADRVAFTSWAAVPVEIPASLPPPAAAPAIEPLSVMGIGSWPRPRWMLQAIHRHMEGRLSEIEFEETARDAVRLAIGAQLRAGVGVVTDGEQRRDNYSSFVGGLLDNCVLVPLTDLLPLVDDPEHFRDQMNSLDVPAEKVRHPAVFGPLGRRRPLAVHELDFAKTLTTGAVKVALPGPYLLTRTMWMDCLDPLAYDSRERLADDIVRVLREELHCLLAAGASLVQFDEPVLTEVVFTGPKKTRSFMCGALSETDDPEVELAFAQDLINRVVAGVSRERTALHVCRGNWTPDESVALVGDYRPLVTLFNNLRVGTLFLESCTPRAGDLDILRQISDDFRIGVGVVNQKSPQVETVDEVVRRGREAINRLGRERVLFTPDCGFATFADNPITAAEIAEAKLGAAVRAAEILKRSLRSSGTMCGPA